MIDNRTIEVNLPTGAGFKADDLDVLKTTLQTIVTLASRCEGKPGEACCCLDEEGWDVSWGLTWVARASRGKEFEEVTGATREEAMQRLREALCLHVSDGCP